MTAFAANGTQPTTSLGQQAMADAMTSYGSSFRNTMLIVAVALAAVTALSSLLLRKGEGTPKPVHDESATAGTAPAAATD